MSSMLSLLALALALFFLVPLAEDVAVAVAFALGLGCVFAFAAFALVCLALAFGMMKVESTQPASVFDLMIDRFIQKDACRRYGCLSEEQERLETAGDWRLIALIHFHSATYQIS